jgi:hypothetical protein
VSLETEVAAYFVSKGLGTLGIDLFLNYMPETPDICGAIFRTGGSPPQGGFGVPGVLHEMPGIQIRFRGVARDSTGPQAKIEAAYRALAEVQGTTLSGTKYLMVRMSQSPFVLERDDRERVVWTVNALAEKELSV